RVPVGAGFRLPVDREEIEPMRERGRGVAGLRRRIVAIEERGQRHQRRRGHRVGARLDAADPVGEARHGFPYHIPPSARMSATCALSWRPSSVMVCRSSLSCAACTTTTLRIPTVPARYWFVVSATLSRA